MTERTQRILAVTLIAFGALSYALFVIQDFSGPLIGGEDYDGSFRGDANYFEFLGYFVRDHWHLGLKPISFLTDDVGYPSGTHIGLLSWCAERDLFHALMLKLAGPGPWIQTYVTLGATIGAVGVTLILRPQHGTLRSALVGYAGSFMAFYAWYKYPYHVNMCAIHWVLMSIAADAVTMRKVADGERLSAPFVLLRAALIVLSAGLDLGYVTGHALTSLTVTVYCAWGELGKRDKRIVHRFLLALPQHPFAELRAHRLASAGAAAMLAVGLFLYVPFVLAVVKDTTTYPMIDAAGNFWASQFHALFPYLPGLHPNSALVHGIFGKDEGVGEYTPGFTLLLAGIVGVRLAHAKNLSARVKPLLITAILVFAFHPRWAKTLQMFPWFAYDRVAGRGTIVLPILLALMGVSVDGWPRWAKRAVVVLAGAEVATALFLVNEFHPAQLAKEHRRYFETVSEAPGKGLLEWPFCIASANFQFTKELCPYYDHTATAYAYRRFHGKSTVSVYLSRAHPLQFKSWMDEGWDGMFMPNDATRMHPTKELRCFDDEQWARFDRLYRGNDFAGIQLYADLLPAECVTMFHDRYGEPTAVQPFPRLGRVEFLKRQ